MHAGRGIHKLEVEALVSEDVQPVLQLKSAAVVLKPTEAKISPLSATRDVIPEGRQVYQNLLVFNLNVAKAAEVALYAPIFNDLLYEAEFESQMWMLYDANKALVATGDAHSQTFFTKLEKGDYTVRLQVRHEKRELLEKISEANLVASFKLTNMLTLDFYENYNQCVVGGRKFVSALLRESTRVLYIAPITQERLNKANLPAQCAWLSGNLVFPQDEAGRREEGAHEWLKQRFQRCRFYNSCSRRRYGQCGQTQGSGNPPGGYLGYQSRGWRWNHDPERFAGRQHSLPRLAQKRKDQC